MGAHLLSFYDNGCRLEGSDGAREVLGLFVSAAGFDCQRGGDERCDALENASMSAQVKPRLPALGLNTRILILVGLLLVTTVVITTLVIKSTPRQFVEDAIGDQMIMQARIAAHLVAIAEQKRNQSMTPAEINQHLREIVNFAKEQRKRAVRRRHILKSIAANHVRSYCPPV